MSGSDELYPPVQYEPGWIVLAIAILVVLIAAAWLLVYFTRPKRNVRAQQSVPPVPMDVPTQLRSEYFARIDQIEQKFNSGELDARATSTALSRAVRGFVNEYSGLEAPVMTLEDLEAIGVYPPLLEAVRTHYLTVFRRQGLADPTLGIQAARTVVNTWH